MGWVIGVMIDCIDRHNLATMPVQRLAGVGVHVESGEIAAADIHPDPVAFLEEVRGGIQSYRKRIDFSGLGQHLLLKAFPEPQALDAIAEKGNFEASLAQDFNGMGATVADLVGKYLGGEKITQSVTYVPTKLVTAGNVSEFITK